MLTSLLWISINAFYGAFILILEVIGGSMGFFGASFASGCAATTVGILWYLVFVVIHDRSRFVAWISESKSDS